MPRKRSWTDEQLREAVAASETYKEVQERLGLRSNHVAIRVRIAELGLDAEHLDAARRRRRAARARELRAGTPRKPSGRRRPSRRWDPDELREAVRGARSYAEVLRRLGYGPGGSTYVQLKREISDLDIDTSHLKGKAWAKGLRRPEMAERRSRPLEEILVRDSDYLNTYALKKRLLRRGIIQGVCAKCGLTEWNGQPAPLQLDHINGDRRDNRLENLRVLCPNCHAQTDTWCAKNVGRYDDEG